MTDDSHLDQRYFIDEYTYNCPFCNRRNVTYHVSGTFDFDWTLNKQCEGAIVVCESCNNRSLHLSFQTVEIRRYVDRRTGIEHYRFSFDGAENPSVDLDSIFFHSVPSSFFVLDERIPKVLRELLSEAEACLKGNHLTGASACARKLIYELAVREKAEGDNYEERLKSLKEVRSDVDPVYFDNLLTVQQLTSEKVHENAYDGWESRHLRPMLATLHEALYELYVAPARRNERRQAMLDIKQELMTQGNSKAAKTPTASD